MSAEFFKTEYQKMGIGVPSLHVVLGSGISHSLTPKVYEKDFSLVGEISFSKVPGLGHATVAGHPGVFRYFKSLKNNKVFCFQLGRLHGYEGLDPKDVVKPLMWAREAGCSHFILTNASGSLKKNFKPGSLMMIQDHFNFTGKNPLMGYNPQDSKGKPFGPRFPDMSEVYSKKLNAALNKCFVKNKIKTHTGVYCGVLGPSYETPAEVSLFSKLGLGAVGMSTVWEAISLKHSGALIGGVSLISNFGCGLVASKPLQHEDVEKIAGLVATKMLKSLFEFCEKHE